MLVDNLAENSLRCPIQSLIGFYGLFFLHCQCILSQKMLYSRKKMNKEIEDFHQTKPDCLFPLNVTKSKILVNVDVYFVFS